MNIELKLKPNSRHCNTLQISVGYELGGYNYFNGQNNRRGYYLYVTPVNKSQVKSQTGRNVTMTEQVLGAGYKMLLKEVRRQSKGALNEAALIAENRKKELIDRVLVEYMLELE